MITIPIENERGERTDLNIFKCTLDLIVEVPTRSPYGETLRGPKGRRSKGQYFSHRIGVIQTGIFLPLLLNVPRQTALFC